MDRGEVARRGIAPVETVQDHEAQQAPEELCAHGGDRRRAVLQDRAQAHGGQRGVAPRSRFYSHESAVAAVQLRRSALGDPKALGEAVGAYMHRRRRGRRHVNLLIKSQDADLPRSTRDVAGDG